MSEPADLRLSTLLVDPAHLMSLSRIALAGVVWLSPERPWFLFVVVAVAAISDVLDGAIGRRTHKAATGTKNVGAWLDPVCDKIFIASAAVAVVVAWHVPAWTLALLLVRDVGIGALVVMFRVVGGTALFHSHDFRARPSGKITTVAQVAALLAAVVYPVAVLPLAIASAGLGVLAVVDRVWLAVKQRRAAALAIGS